MKLLEITSPTYKHSDVELAFYTADVKRLYQLVDAVTKEKIIKEMLDVKKYGVYFLGEDYHNEACSIFYSFGCEDPISSAGVKEIYRSVEKIFESYGINTEELLAGLNFYKMPDKVWVKSDHSSPNFYLSANEEFTSLCGISKKIKYEVVDDIDIEHVERITEGGLGFLLIDNLRTIYTLPAKKILWLSIINEHLKGERDILECKTALIEQGQGAFAKI
jgi:hypothetical protein